MGSFFRSEEMSLCQLFLQSDAAYSCVSELGELGLVQFRDLNPDVNAFQRKFVNEVRRCYDMERKLNFLKDEVIKDKIPIFESNDDPIAPIPQDMNAFEATFESLETELMALNEHAMVLEKNYSDLIDLKHVLIQAEKFFEKADKIEHDDRLHDLEDGSNSSLHLNLSYVAGVILRERLPAFERMLWRICLGNVHLQKAEIEEALEDPSSGENIYKSVFIIFYQGDQLKAKVKKICEGFRATMYSCPESQLARKAMLFEVQVKIEDLQIIFNETRNHRRRTLLIVAKNLKNWQRKAIKAKAIYHALNIFNLDVTEKCLIAECWVPVLDIDNVRKALIRGAEIADSTVPPILNQMETTEEPPTFNRTNKFTNGFQNIIDAYGIASYREMNPAPYTTITFPFLFAVMFGDLGHGLIMTLCALWMVVKEKPLIAKKSDNEIWNIFFGGRYIILLMGLFSMYTGMIYNDVFSRSMNLFESGWKIKYNSSTVMENKVLQLDPQSDFYETYLMGLDPVWQVATLNKIIFENGYKMKISIIFGVLHMVFGLIIGCLNHIYFKNWITIISEIIPQMIFLIFLFGYLAALMFIKWITFSATNDEAHSAHCAPSILITFINMILFKKANTDAPCSPWMFPYQDKLQLMLFLSAMICIPWMLLLRPLLLKIFRKKAGKQNEHENGSKHEDDEDMGEIMIHQGIHTIEYVLGCVSHTASYLRLWALSLAHAQLSEVLWKMVLQLPSSVKNESTEPFIWFFVWIFFALWAVLTLGVLVLMEGLSAFLHTLRLHWVEFQSKFYSGRGYAFQPFSFDVLGQDDYN